ncbi:MAG TPA: hypothetical protein VK765_06180 [Solirubrobacteraceae bacterium]|nr:hypothetical protein [Solirubrobacteraceae bacterium]
MSIGTDDQPIPSERVEEAPPGVVRGARGHDVAYQARDIRRPRATLVLVLAVWAHAEGLADILLVDPSQRSCDEASVVALYNDRALLAEARDAGASRNEAGAAELWKSRAHRARTVSLSGSRPQSQGAMEPSEWMRTDLGIDTDSGVVLGTARYASS